MRRAGEWELLYLDGDPVPASYSEVHAVAYEMRQRSRDVAEVADTLRRLSHLDGWRGEAATTFAEKASDVLEDLGKVEERYAKVAGALDTWAHEVETARARTGTALAAASEAHREVRAHTVTVTHSPEPTPAQVTEQQSHDRMREAAEERLAQARADLRNAMSDLDEAAGRAERGINDAADVWDDGWTGNFKGWVRKHAELIEIICKALEIIGTIIGAIVLVLVLTIGAPFALLIAAFAVSVLLFAGHAMLFAADTGKASASDLVWDSVGILLSGVSFGAGKYATKGLQQLVPGMATRLGGAARVSALERLVGKNATQFRNSLRIQNPSNNLLRWARGLEETARVEGAGVRQAVLDLQELQPSRLSTLLHQDRELAKMNAVVRQLKNLGPTPTEVEDLVRIQREIWTALGATTGGTAIYFKDLPKYPQNAIDIGNYVEERYPWVLRRAVAPLTPSF
jgi:uncharacterized protein YukE